MFSEYVKYAHLTEAMLLDSGIKTKTARYAAWDADNKNKHSVTYNALWNKIILAHVTNYPFVPIPYINYFVIKYYIVKINKWFTIYNQL